MPSFHDFEAKSIDGQDRSLSAYKGKVALVVNVASRCGLTPQYAKLEELYGKYKGRGLEILGFPCNQFGAQEPGSEAEIQEFCSSKYAVTFPLFAKVEVNGAGRHPVYEYLTAEPTAPDGPGNIRWNFAKFLIGRDGQVAARFSPTVDPLAPEVIEAIERAL